MEQVKLFSVICQADGEMSAKLIGLENTMNSWLKSRGDEIEIVRVLNQNHAERGWYNNIIMFSVFYKEKPKTKTTPPLEIKLGGRV